MIKIRIKIDIEPEADDFITHLANFLSKYDEDAVITYTATKTVPVSGIKEPINYIEPEGEKIVTTQDINPPPPHKKKIDGKMVDRIANNEAVEFHR